MGRFGEPLPLILYSDPSQLHPSQYDCDCACTLELPSVLAAQPGAGSYDCDCACTLDVPQGLSVATLFGSYDSDCACALDLPGGLPVPSGTTPWVRQTEALRISLGGEWQAYFNPAGPVGIAVLNADAQRVLAAFEAPIPPQSAVERLPEWPPPKVRGTVQTLARVGLLRPLEMPSLPVSRPSTLAAWIHVTEACNLNCPYCYVRKRPCTMSEQVGRWAVDRLVEMACHDGYKTLKIKYAGGEPTLNFPLIQLLHARAARRTSDAGLALDEVILSNGVGVTDAMLDFVAQEGIWLMVSLDGGEDSHDRVRSTGDGRGTYPAVKSTVDRALERGLRPNISITLTALNLDGAAGAVAFALERELPFNLNFLRECSPAGARGGPSPLVPASTRLARAMSGIFDLIETVPGYPLPLSGILDRAHLDLPHSYPCSAGRDYLAVGTDGRVSACQMLMEEPWTDLAAENPLAQVQQRGQELFKPAEAQPECRTCQWRTACSGGCPLLRGTVLHDAYCQVYQVLFPRLIQLEAKRLIAQRLS
jgi:uncharacterized protein